MHSNTCVLTLEHKLLHLDLVELVGADDDAVAGEMDAAAGLQSFNLLWGEGRTCDFYRWTLYGVEETLFITIDN